MPGTSLIRKAAIQSTILVWLLPAPFAFAAHDWKYEDTRDDVKEFVSGGTLHVHLSVGDLRIARGSSDKIRMRYTVRSEHERNVQETKVDFEVHGNDASIEFHAPRSGTEFDVNLEVPQQTNLDLHDKVGDVTVEGVDGDKDVDLNVGDIRVMADRKSYRMVRASTNIGDVNGSDYGEANGWLGKTLRYHGDGKYELRAHVLMGDITLEGK